RTMFIPYYNSHSMRRVASMPERRREPFIWPPRQLRTLKRQTRVSMINLFRTTSRATAAILLAVALLPGAASAQKVLKFIPQADLRILDPIATTAYITRNHGYMVYDTLFAINDKFEVKEQ